MTWASEVGWITGQTGTISGDIAELFVLYDGLNMSVIDLTQRVIVLEGEVVAINGTLAALPDLSGYTALVADVSDLLTRVGVLEAGFAALPDLSGYPTLLADVAQLKLDVAAIQGTLAGLPDLSGYGALVTEVGSLRDDLTALQGTVAALPDLSGYGALVTQVGDHETRIGALESWRAVDEPEIDQLRIDVDALIAGGGGGGGTSTIINLKYPDDFTPAMILGFLSEYANIGPAPADTEVTVFITGDASNSVPVYLVAQQRAGVSDLEYPVRVVNARTTGELILTTDWVIANGPLFGSLAAIRAKDEAIFSVFTNSMQSAVTPLPGSAEIVTIATESIFCDTLEANGVAPNGVANSGKLIRARLGKRNFFRVRAVVVEGATHDTEISYVGVNVRLIDPLSTAPHSFEAATPVTGGASLGPVPAGQRTYQLPTNEVIGGGAAGWTELSLSSDADEGVYYLEPIVSYNNVGPFVPATKVHILVEFGAPGEKFKTDRYDDIPSYI